MCSDNQAQRARSFKIAINVTKCSQQSAKTFQTLEAFATNPKKLEQMKLLILVIRINGIDFLQPFFSRIPLTSFS